ncbi:MAG: hypothetical protein R6U41_06950 [Desulfosalsimonas sp.]|uniref:hypothetical protein n=1 Tax=Desulfosalsimonas sp. TaxID=3073848 RepID=UPI003970F892
MIIGHMKKVPGHPQGSVPAANKISAQHFCDMAMQALCFLKWQLRPEFLLHLMINKVKISRTAPGKPIFPHAPIQGLKNHRCLMTRKVLDPVNAELAFKQGRQGQNGFTF